MPEPEVTMPWFPRCEIPVLPAASPCSSCILCSVCSCPSAPALTSAHPGTSGSWHMAFPSTQPWRMQWECRRSKTFLLFLCHLGFSLSASSWVPATVICCKTQMFLVQWLLSNHQILQQKTTRPIVWNCNSC